MSRIAGKPSFTIDTWIVPAKGGPIMPASMGGLTNNRDTVPGIEHFAGMINTDQEFVEDRVAFTGLPAVNVTWIDRGYRSGLAMFALKEQRMCDSALLLSRRDPAGDALVAEWFWKSVRQVHPDLDLVPAMSALQATTNPLCIVVSEITGADRPAALDFVEMCFAMAFAWVDGNRAG